MKQTVIYNEMDLEAWYKQAQVELTRSNVGITIITKRASRTVAQNSALHSTLREYAKELNEAGFDFTDFINNVKSGYRVSWTLENIKQIFKDISVAMYHKPSTTSLTTKEMQSVYKNFAERLSELSGVYVAWHSKEDAMLKDFSC